MSLKPNPGHTAPDVVDAAIGTPDVAFLLRSERDGGGDDRVYTATDGSENEAAATATVVVPKSKK